MGAQYALSLIPVNVRPAAAHLSLATHPFAFRFIDLVSVCVFRGSGDVNIVDSAGARKTQP